MQFNVTFRSIEPSVALRAYAEEKLARIKKYVKEPIEAHVVLKVEKFRHIAEATIDANGARFKGAEETEDMYAAIDMLADTLEGQVKKSKDKSSSRKRGGNSSRELHEASALDSVGSLDENEAPAIIRTESVFAKPMDVDEAALQLKISSGEFMVFTNRHTNRVNVLYKRKDGHFGLIETVS